MDFGAVFKEVLATLRAVDADIPAFDATPTQIWTSVQALRQSFVSDLQGGTLKLPAWVIKLGNDEQDTDWGVDSKTNRASLAIYYIAPEATKQATIHAKLRLYRAAIDDSDDFESFQSPPERGRIDTSDDSDVNAYVVAEAGARVMSGHVEWMPGLLVPA